MIPFTVRCSVMLCLLASYLCFSNLTFGREITSHSRRGRSPYVELPLAFEANRGQAAPEVKYLSRIGSYTLWLMADGITLQPTDMVGKVGPNPPYSDVSLHGRSALRMSFVGIASDAVASGFDELPGKIHYLAGSNSALWHRNISLFRGVRYSRLYRGIDIVFYGNSGKLEYDFIVAPGADPGQIRFRINHANSIGFDRSGNLVVRSSGHTFRMLAPNVYQRIGRVRRRVAGRYELSPSGTVFFRVGAYDPERALIIDPVFQYSSYLPTAAPGNGIAVDSSGNAYVISAGFVTKVNSAGSAIVYSTFLGEPLTAIAVNGSGNAFVTGAGILVLKLSADGSSILFIKHLGASSTSDYGLGITLDPSGNVYVAGSATHITPTPGAYQTTCVSKCSFAVKLNSAGAVSYATYLGGVSGARGIAVDRNGSAYLTGFTVGSGFPTTANAVFPTYRGGQDDAFVTKLNSSGSALVYSTFLGGSGEDDGNAIAVDQSGNSYVVGITRSTADFPVTPGAFDARYTPCCDDSFVTKLSADGSKLIYSTYLGAGNVDDAFGVAVDRFNQAYVVGTTRSSNFPQTSNRLQNFGGGTCGSTNGVPDPCFDAFIFTLNAAGSSIIYYSTLLGGSGNDGASGVAVDASLNVYVTGYTGSTNFPTHKAIDSQYSAVNLDGFMAKVVIAADLVASVNAPASVSSGSNLMYSFSASNAGPDGADGATLTAKIPAGTTFVGFTNTNGSCVVSSGTLACKRSSRLLPGHAWGPVTLTVKVTAAAGSTISNTVQVAANTQDLQTANNRVAIVSSVK